MQFKEIIQDIDNEPHHEQITLVKTWVADQQYADAAAFIESLEPQKLTTNMGIPLHVAASTFLYDHFETLYINPAQCEKWLPSYEAWYKDRPDCPFAAATLFHIFAITGFAYRGPEYSSKVSKKGWEMLEIYLEKSHQVLTQAQGKHGGHWYWLKSLNDLSVMDCQEWPEIERRFNNCVRKLPLDPSVYSTTAFLLLPRWHGDFEVLETFISRAADQTKNAFGDGLYARLYMHILKHEDAPDLHINKARLRRGVEDWLERFPNQKFQTRIASEVFLMDEFELAQTLLENLEELHLLEWQSEMTPKGANSLCREFTGR